MLNISTSDLYDEKVKYLIINTEKSVVIQIEESNYENRMIINLFMIKILFYVT